MLRANPDSWIHQLVACWRETVDSLVKTDFSSGLLSTPRHWRARFSTFPHEQGHTDTVGCIQSSYILLSCGNKCGKALSGRKRWDSLESLPSQCALRMPACKPRLYSDTIQNLGSRGKQRLTVLDCPNQRTFFFFLSIFALPKVSYYRSLIPYSFPRFIKMLWFSHLETEGAPGVERPPLPLLLKERSPGRWFPSATNNCQTSTVWGTLPITWINTTVTKKSWQELPGH